MKKTSPAKSQKNWKHRFTTVTPFSKAVALALFILLPLFTFMVGIEVAKKTMQWTCQYENARESKLLGTKHLPFEFGK